MLVNVTLITITSILIIMVMLTRYEDLAVGAPYHGHGAVFLFQVSSFSLNPHLLGPNPLDPRRDPELSF